MGGQGAGPTGKEEKPENKKEDGLKQNVTCKCLAKISTAKLLESLLQ